MKAIGIIPARMAASRFPGKPLEKLLGMPMIGHCYHRTRLSLGKKNTYVATCDKSISDYIKKIGGHVIMTGKYHNRATTRTAEALEIIETKSGIKNDIVVMLQGDEPLISPKTIMNSITHFKDPSVEIVNIMALLKARKDFFDKNNIKVVINNKSDALYFSRQPIPSPWKGWRFLPKYMQTGVIAFRRETLLWFNKMEETPLERYESIDMNRVLERGKKIRMILSNTFTIGVDTPSELKKAEMMMKKDPVTSYYLGKNE